MSERGRPRAKIVVVGSVNMDLAGMVRRLPRPGETAIGHGFRTAPGGKGANQAVAAARLGGEVAFVGCVGADAFGAELMRCLASDGIDTRWIRRVPSEPSGVALIGVEEDGGENSIMVFPGANSTLSPDDIGAAREALCAAGMIVCSLEVPIAAVIAAAEMAAQSDVPVLLNPAPAQPISAELYRLTSIATPNEHEARTLVGEPSASAADAAAALHRLGVERVVVTLGAAGALVSDGAAGERFLVPAAHAGETVDTTAAGDCFTGALAVALGEGRELPEAVRFAGAAAALSVTRPGAQSSLPTRSEVDSLLANAASRSAEP